MISAETRSKCAKGCETEKDEAFLRKGKKTQASRRVDEGKKMGDEITKLAGV